MWGCAFYSLLGITAQQIEVYDIHRCARYVSRCESNSRNVNRGSFRYFWTDDAYAFWKLHVSGKDQAFLAGKVSCAKRK